LRRWFRSLEFAFFLIAGISSELLISYAMVAIGKAYDTRLSHLASNRGRMAVQYVAKGLGCVKTQEFEAQGK